MLQVLRSCMQHSVRKVNCLPTFVRMVCAERWIVQRSMAENWLLHSSNKCRWGLTAMGLAAQYARPMQRVQNGGSLARPITPMLEKTRGTSGRWVLPRPRQQISQWHKCWCVTLARLVEVACPVSFSASSLGRHCELTSVGTDYQVHALSTLHVSEPMQTD